MNTNTGRVYELGAEFAEGLEAGQLARERPLGKTPPGSHEAFFMALEQQAATEDERAAAQDARRGDRVVPVSAEVAQAQRLGQRELERRARRRKAAKQARKRNRS